jgi:hypothetical protein
MFLSFQLLDTLIQQLVRQPEVLVHVFSLVLPPPAFSVRIAPLSGLRHPVLSISHTSGNVTYSAYTRLVPVPVPRSTTYLIRARDLRTRRGILRPWTFKVLLKGRGNKYTSIKELLMFQ